LLFVVLVAVIFTHVFVSIPSQDPAALNSPAPVCVLMFALDEFKFLPHPHRISLRPSSHSCCNCGTHNQWQPPPAFRSDAIDKDNGKFISLIEFLRRKFYVYVMISSSSFRILSHARTQVLVVDGGCGGLYTLSPSPPQGACVLACF